MKRRLDAQSRYAASGTDKPLVARRSALRELEGRAYTLQKHRVMLEGLATSLDVDDKTVRASACSLACAD